MKARIISITLFLSAIFFFIPSSYAAVHGIYINGETAVNTNQINFLIKNAKEVGINTFVVDYERNSKKYSDNMQLIKNSGIKYVARIVIFPGGATADQVKSQAYLQKKLALIQQALNIGAQEIQIDYIRYKASQPPSERNAQDIAKVIGYFSQYVSKKGIPLQIDVFGISSFKPSVYIGQDNSLIAPRVNTICPMVYPSHYKPYELHLHTPYQTVYTSLVSLKKQIKAYPNVKIVAFIEIYNFHYPQMSDATRIQYILAQFAAVSDSGANGWYIWSAGNKYNFLFSLLRDMQAGKIKQPDFSKLLASSLTTKKAKKGVGVANKEMHDKEVNNNANTEVNADHTKSEAVITGNTKDIKGDKASNASKASKDNNEATTNANAKNTNEVMNKDKADSKNTADVNQNDLANPNPG